MTPTFPFTPVTHPAGMQADVAPIQKTALGICMVALVILFSRFCDEFGGAFHLPGFILVLLMLFSFASGKLFQGFSNPVGRCMLLLVVWVTIASVFSIWRTNSIPIYEALLMTLVYFAVVSGLVSTLQHVRQIIGALAVSFLLAAFLSFVFAGAQSGERVKLAIGSYADPNQYSMSLLMGIPLWWFMAASSKTKQAKVFCFLCTLPIFYVFFGTGSRGGVLGLIAVMLLDFFSSSASKKVLIAAVTVIGALVVVSTMPSYIKTRYATFFDSSSVNLSNQTDEAAFLLKGDMDSAEGRKQLLYKSIAITLKNPIFGVGPGNFPTSVFSHAKENGEAYAWFETHNSYTQISSETGIPGLILFVGLIFFSFKNLAGVIRLTGPRGPKPWPDMWKAASYLRLSLVGTSVSAFFLSSGYVPEIYVLAGLSVALERVLRLQAATFVPTVNLPQPSVSAGFVRPPRSARYPQEPRWAHPHSL